MEVWELRRWKRKIYFYPNLRELRSDLAKEDFQSIKCLAFLHQQVIWPSR